MIPPTAQKGHMPMQETRPSDSCLHRIPRDLQPRASFPKGLNQIPLLSPDCEQQEVYSRPVAHLLISFPRRIKLDLGSDISAEEANWWNVLLSPDSGWEIATEYNQRTYMPPWSAQLSDTVHINLALHSSLEKSEPPSPNIALGYLVRFCSRHRLYGQCSAGLAAVLYIPFINGRPATLPIPILVASSTSLAP